MIFGGRYWAIGLLATAGAIVAAHAEDAGKRDFPATLVVEEPQVETEIAPQIAHWGESNARRTDVSADLALKLAKPFGVVIRPDYTFLRPGGSGFQALEVETKYQFVANADHEIVFSAGVSSVLGGTGSSAVGADTYTSVIPTIYFGKGAGDLPESLAWARPLALTGQVGFVAPTRLRSRTGLPSAGADAEFEANPYVVSLQGSLQYSFAYAAENVLGNVVPQAVAGLIPLVEYEFEVPVANIGDHGTTLGTINPGFLWLDQEHDITWGLEALIPINRASGTHPGVRLQLSYSFKTPWPLAGVAPH